MYLRHADNIDMNDKCDERELTYTNLAKTYDDKVMKRVE